MSDETYRYWSSGLMAAIHSDEHTVELVEAANGGAQVEIDGVPMFDGLAYPAEQFNIATGSEYEQYLTADGRSKFRDVYSSGETDE